MIFRKKSPLYITDSHASSNYHQSGTGLNIPKSSQSGRLAILKWQPQAIFSSYSNFAPKTALLTQIVYRDQLCNINQFICLYFLTPFSENNCSEHPYFSDCSLNS